MRGIASFAVTLLSVILIVAPAAEAQKTEKELTAKQLAIFSVGGESAVAIISRANGMTLSGELSMNGSQGNFDFCFRAPDSFYLRMSLGSVTLEQWYDGTRGWQKSAGGILAAFEGRELDRFLLESRVLSFTYVRPDSRLKIFVGEKKVLKNRDVKELLLVSSNDTMRLYLDARTHLPIDKLSRLDNMLADETIDSGGFRHGIFLPLRTTTELRGTGLVSTSILTSFALNQTCAVWHAIPKENVQPSIPEVGETEIRFHFVDGHIYVPVTLKNGKKGFMLLDSGASSNFLLKRVADELQLENIAQIPSRGVAGIEYVGLVQMDSLLIGDQVFPTTPFGVTEIDFLNDRSIAGMDCFGILGYEFLARQMITVDYENELVRLNPSLSSVAASTYELPFSLHLNLPVVTADIDGNSASLLIDLGNNSGVLIHEPFARDHNIAVSEEQQHSGVTGLGGVVATSGTSIRKLRLLTSDSSALAPLAFQNLEAIITASSSGLSGSVDVDGNLGSRFLANYVVTFDYAHRRLFLEPKVR